MSTEGTNWTALKGGLPSIQVRDMQVQKRETDLVIATFGRGFYVLDDYSALREVTPATLAEEARLYPAASRVLVQLERAWSGRQRGHRVTVGQLPGGRIRRSGRSSRTTSVRRCPRTRSSC